MSEVGEESSERRKPSCNGIDFGFEICFLFLLVLISGVGRSFFENSFLSTEFWGTQLCSGEEAKKILDWEKSVIKPKPFKLSL